MKWRPLKALNRVRPRPKLTTTAWFFLLANVVVTVAGVVVFALGSAATSDSSGVTSADFWAPLGVGLVATGVAGLALVAYVVVTDTTKNRMVVLWSTGIEDLFYENTTNIVDEYRKFFKMDLERMDILGTGLNRFRGDWRDQFESWGASRQVRILALDPEFSTCSDVAQHDDQPAGTSGGSQGRGVPAASVAAIRDREEGNPDESMENEVAELINDTKGARSAHPESFQVRLYRALPAVTMVRVDNQIFWAPYLVGRRASRTPTFLIRRGGMLFDVLSQHFEKLWSDEFSKQV